MLPVAVLLLALGQGVPGQTAASADLQRIRAGLADPQHPIETSIVTEGDKPVYRLEIRHKPPPPVWEHPFPVPSYVRPSMPIYHYEFLEQVTPREFRASVLYGAPMSPYGGVGVGIPVIPAVQAFVKAWKAESRAIRQKKARAEVLAALQELQQARVAALCPVVIPRD